MDATQEHGAWGSWKEGLRRGEGELKPTGEAADKSAVLLMLEAITAGSCNEDVNYQRLEIMGDAFLKYAVSTYLYLAHPTWHEVSHSAASLSLARPSSNSNACLTHELHVQVLRASVRAPNQGMHCVSKRFVRCRHIVNHADGEEGS